MTSSVRIRIKVGSLELEYEGDPSFLTDELKALLVTMDGLSNHAPENIEPAIAKGADSPITPSQGSINVSTNTIAAHLDAKTGPELIICAMAQLELMLGKSQSNRTEILTEMKNATSYYSGNYRSNMTKNLARLVKTKRINQVATDTYALSSTEKNVVEAKVAAID